MRFAVVSDIHGNLTALKSVFDHLNSVGYIDAVWCLGDVVGYGPDPNECIDFLREFDLRCVGGNHDLGSAGLIDLRVFNSEARAACRWTASQLTDENRQFLVNLPKVISEGAYTLVHGSPMDPIWEYILSSAQAKRNFPFLETEHCFVGHTHIPAVYLYFLDGDNCISAPPPVERGLDLGSLKARAIANPGSVGQPRDGDPRASCAVLDQETSTLTYYRVPYDIEAVQRRMKDLGLPKMLYERLSFGW